MGSTTTSLAVESVTPEKARDFLACNFPHNRPLRQHWVKHLANEMREGRFMPTAEIHVMYRNGEPVLVNGQHTCNAIIEYGKTVRCTVRKTSTTEIGQVAMMYSFGHDNGVKRTFKDGLGAYNISDEIGLGSHHTERLATAIRHIRMGFHEDGRGRGRGMAGKAVSLTELIEVMPQWAIYAKMFWDNTIAPTGTFAGIKKAINKRAVLSVLLVTYRYAPVEAAKFWGGIIEPGLNDTDARWYARRVIEDAIRSTGKAFTMTPSMQSRMIAKTWNNFVNEVEMRQMPRRVDIDESARIVIAKTPFNGKQPPPPWLPEDSRP